MTVIPDSDKNHQWMLKLMEESLVTHRVIAWSQNLPANGLIMTKR